MIPVHLLMNAAANSRKRYPAMTLEFPAPHIAILKPSRAVTQARTMGFVALVMGFVMAAVLAAAIAANLSGHGHKSVMLPKAMTLLLTFLFTVGVAFAVVIRRVRHSAKILFDRKQGMVWKEARSLEPVWQGGIRLRDVSAIELAPASGRSYRWELSLVSSTRRDLRAAIVSDVTPDGLRSNAAELSRFLNIPFTDRSSR
jgi:hypothetical protein